MPARVLCWLQGLRYGENPHQSAAFYTDASLAGEQGWGQRSSSSSSSDASAAADTCSTAGTGLSAHWPPPCARRLQGLPPSSTTLLLAKLAYNSLAAACFP